MRRLFVCATAAMTALAFTACSRQGASPAAAAANPPAAGASTAAGAAISGPCPAKAGDWTRNGEPKRYGVDDLWEYIDGAAEQFVAYGFEQLVTATYSNPAGVTATVDVYQMADPLRAFGIYAQETNPNAERVPVGVEGRVNANVVSFWSADSYVKIVTTPASGSFKPQAMALAGSLAALLGPAGEPPPILRVFPANGLVPGSVKFTPTDILGQREFREGFEAQYQAGTGRSTLMMIPFETPEGARGGLARYETFLGKSGKPPRRMAKPGDGGIAATDSFSGLIVMIRTGRWLTVSVSASDERAATALLTDLAAKLAEHQAAPKDGTS